MEQHTSQQFTISNSITKEFYNSNSFNKSSLTINTNITSVQENVDERWSEIKVQGKNIGCRCYHSMSSSNNKIYIYGGYDSEQGILHDFYCLSLASINKQYQWENLTNLKSKNYPGPRKRHSSVIYKDKEKEYLVLFGGQKGCTESTNAIHQYSIKDKKWEILLVKEGQKPLPVDSHSTVIFKSNEDIEMIVFGGYTNQGDYSNLLWSFNFKNCVWTLVNVIQAIPAPRAGAAAAVHKHCIYVFGGQAQNNIKFNDLWQFDMLQKQWTNIKYMTELLPEPRNGHSLIVYNDYLFTFGGILGVTKEKNDIFAFDLHQNSWYQVHTGTNAIYSRSPDVAQIKRQNQQLKKRQSVRPSPKKQFSPSISPNRKDHSEKILSLQCRPQQQELNKCQSLSPQKVKNMERSLLGYQAASSLKQKKIKQFLEKKAQMLDEIQPLQKEKEQIVQEHSPTTEAMKNSLHIIGDQQKTLQSLILNQTLSGMIQPVIFDQKNCILVGKKPCARDGHTCCVVGNKMMIFGGDRHMMTLNDLFYFDLEMSIQKHIN